MHRPLATLTVLAAITGTAVAQTPSFVNWESAHVHPIDLSPDGTRLAAVNTPDNRVEIFDVNDVGALRHAGSVPVGLEPVTARFRTDTELWVVNAISDSVSKVDLATLSVTATVRVGDEPGDVVFASGKMYVSVTTENLVRAYDPDDLALPPVDIPIVGEDPRALATDGTDVFGAIHMAGNATTVLHLSVVCDPNFNPYPGTPNPTPNDGAGFNPPINPALPPPPAVPTILRQQADGHYVDVQGTDWTAHAITMTGSPMPFWNMSRNKAFRISGADDTVLHYALDGGPAIATAIALRPTNGRINVVGLAANNLEPFEENLRGVFIDSSMASIDPASGTPDFEVINPHLVSFLPAPLGTAPRFEGPGIDAAAGPVRQQTLGDPGGIAWSPDGTFKLVTGRGTNNVVRFGPAGAFLRDGGIDSLATFFAVFFAGTTAQERLDLEAYLLSFAEDTHAGVGVTVTLDGGANSDTALRDQLESIADAGQVGLVVKGLADGLAPGEQRGYTYQGGGQYDADRVGETITTAGLDALVAAGHPQSWTLVALGTETRVGIDRDEDTFLDGDELQFCTNGADPTDFPGSDPCPADLTGPDGVKDNEVSVSDLLLVLAQWGAPPGSRADAKCDYPEGVNVGDLLKVLADWGPCPFPGD